MRGEGKKHVHSQSQRAVGNTDLRAGKIAAKSSDPGGAPWVRDLIVESARKRGRAKNGRWRKGAERGGAGGAQRPAFAGGNLLAQKRSGHGRSQTRRVQIVEAGGGQGGGLHGDRPVWRPK